jgi:hypothetical protein
LVGGSAGGGAGSTAGVFGVPPKPGAAYAGTLTAVAVGIAISTPAMAIFLMLLRTPDDIARVIGSLPSTGSRIATDVAT